MEEKLTESDIASEVLHYRNCRGMMMGSYDHLKGTTTDKPFVIVPPPYGQKEMDLTSQARSLVEKGFNVIRYQTIHSHGSGEIRPTEIKDDIVSTLNFLQREYGIRHFGIMTNSLGSEMAIELVVTDPRINFLIGDGFFSKDDMASEDSGPSVAVGIRGEVEKPPPVLESEVITACYLPSHIVTNKEIIDAGLKTTEVALRRGLGVKERRAAGPDETAADMMAEVGKKILAKANLSPQDIDLIICSTDVGDAAEPETATAVQAKIGASCPAFGVSMSCTGWICAVEIALRQLDSGKKRILVLAASLVGSRTPFHNLMHRSIFGDGAGGILIREEDRERFLGNSFWTDGRYYSKIFIPHSWTKMPDDIPDEYKGSFYMVEDQPMFFEVLDTVVPPLFNRVLNKAKVNIDDIDLYLLHYPSKPLFERSMKILNIPREKTFHRFEQYGNLAAAEMPVFIDEATRAGRIKKGDLVFILVYGAGFTMGGSILRS
jgi:3-oxoacyl-[acyl-carrier-protein] synthase-3